MYDNFLTFPGESWYTISIVACNKDTDALSVTQIGSSYEDMCNMFSYNKLKTKLGNLLLQMRYELSKKSNSKLPMEEVVSKRIKRVKVFRFGDERILDLENNDNNTTIFHKKTLIKTIYNTIEKDLKMCAIIHLKFVENDIRNVSGFELYRAPGGRKSVCIDLR